ncbi:PAS domain-containing sensor histidine kinase [Saprospiraceae bacterium]|nr:PAS domain-containing sensor histidine kinase [Saprospiraceae bacterium]
MNELRDLASRLQAIIDTAIDGIITISDRGIIETINKSAARLFQYQPEEVLGHNIKMLMPEPYRAEHDQYISNYNETRKPKIIGIGREVIGMTKNGEHFPFRLAVSEVVLNDRVIFTGIVHDISDLKSTKDRLKKLNEELEEKVEERTDELEKVVNSLLSTNKQLEQRENELSVALSKEKELNELKTRFVSMASHEFRTPLSSIMSSVSLISKYNEKGDLEKSKKHIDRIKSSVNNLTGILNDFLSLSKIEEGKVAVDYHRINLRELCNGILKEVAGLIKGNKKIDHSRVSDLSITTDPRILKNIMFNLISNAVKYTKEDDGHIIISAYKSENNIIIEVEDNGLGIPENEQKHLFDRFFRASNVETIQGTGLGLNIVRRYVKLLNGRIEYTSKENKGTTFTLTIPNTNTLV